MIVLRIDLDVIKILLRLCYMRRGKSKRGYPISSNVELELKIEAKSFASDEDDMTSMPFIIVITDSLPLFRIRLEISPNNVDQFLSLFVNLNRLFTAALLHFL